MKNQQAFRLSVLSVACLTAFGSVQADEVAELTQPDSSVSVRAGTWTNERHQQGIYDSQREGGPVGSIDIDLNKRDNETGTWFTVKGKDLGLEIGEIRAEYLRQGNVGISIEQSRLTRDNPNTFATGLRGIGTTNLTMSGAGANALPFSNVDLGTKRDLTQIGFYKSLTEMLDTRINFKHEDKSGTRHWGRGGQPAFAVEPIDASTDQLELTLNFADEKLQVSGGYNGSWYKNKNNLVDMITQGAAPATFANHTYISLPLDNEAHQLFVNAGYNFSPATRGTFKWERSEAKQNEAFPTNNVPGMPLVPGVPGNLAGEVETTLLQAGLSTKFAPNWSGLVNLRYHDVNDKTPVTRFVQVGACTTQGNCTENTPYSYTTVTAKAETTYRLPDGYGLTGSVEDRRQERNVPSGENNAAGLDVQRVVPYRSETDELTWKLELRKSLSESVNGAVSYAYSERDGSNYTSAAAGPGGAVSDLINPIHLADRNRQKVRLALDWSPAERLSMQGVAELAEDDYVTSQERPFGLTNGQASLLSLDLNYAISDNWSINAWAAVDRTYAEQLNRNMLTPNRDMKSELSDTGKSIGLGVKGKPTSKLNTGADFELTRTDSKYDQNLRTSGASLPTEPLPEIENRLTRIKLFAEYAMDKQNEVRFDFIHEHWRTNDWSYLFRNGTSFVYSGGATTDDGTVVSASPDQESNYVGLRYTYRFR